MIGLTQARVQPVQPQGNEAMTRILKAWLMLALAVILVRGELAVASSDPLPVASVMELEEALHQVQGKPSLVRIRADWNVSDSELDKQLASGCILEALPEITWFEWDVTANTDADREFLRKYDVSGLPVFLLFDADGNHLEGQDIVGYLPAEKIFTTLTEAFDLPAASEFEDCREKYEYSREKKDAATARAWDELIGNSYEYFYSRYEALEANFRLSEHDYWDIDQDMGTLTLSVGDVPVFEANIAIVGSVISAHGVWEWSWSNTSVDSKLSAPIETVRRYGAAHGMEKLTEWRWVAEERDGWEMAAIANYLLEGEGVYIAPAGDLITFVVITDILEVE